ncbi:MAG: electron transfer flavoprotein subunit beta/FixA family protein [Cyanobacteria bacterium P01_H01_bin.74]
MTIAVLIKPVHDNTKLKFQDGKPQTANAPLMMNPFDEYALESALRVKSVIPTESVTVIAFSTQAGKEVLKKAIAAGADAGLLINHEGLENTDANAVSALFAAVVKSLDACHLVLCGQSTLDDASGQMCSLLAEHLGWHGVSGVKAVEKNEGAENSLKISRETDYASREVLAVSLPMILGVAKCDYELRSSNIKGVMKANKTNIPIQTIQDYEFSVDQLLTAIQKTTVTKRWQRPEKTAGTIVKGLSPDEAAKGIVQYLQAQQLI